MKHLRVVLALILCLALACMSSAALAATDQYTQVPKVKVSVPREGIAGRQLGYLTVNSNIPGFMTMTLLSESGVELFTVADHAEIHSGDNSIDFVATDPENKVLAAGEYTVRVQVVSQFGVACESVTATLKITEPLDAATANGGARPADADEDEDDDAASTSSSSTASSSTSGKSDDDDDDDEDSKSSSSTASSTSTKTTKATETIPMTTGEYAMGDEGLMIGVGVPDKADQTDAGFWGLTAQSTDAEIWAAMIREMPRINVGESESAYVYDSTESGRKRIGTVFGMSQGVNVIKVRDDGWTLVECYRNEDGAFIRGYIASSKITYATPNDQYGILVDKKTQTLTVFKDGERIGSCLVTTGLATPKYPVRETPAGEFVTATRRGTLDYYGQGYSRFTIRYNGIYHIREIASTRENGGDYSKMEAALGTKSTRGSICIQAEPSADGGINAEWIWNITEDNKRVKILILDDKERTEVPDLD